MSFRIEVEGGQAVKLPTAGKYCDRDIFVTGSNNAADLQTKYAEGKVDGLGEGAAICAAKHFVHNFVGDGSSSVSFHVPFEPDTVQIIGCSPFANTKEYALAMFVYDRRAFGFLGGAALHGKTSTGILTTTMMTTTSALKRYSRTEDGVITIKGIATSVVFDPDYLYTVVAVKYTEQTDKERITDFVNRLTGSGTVTLNQATVNAAFTDDEWAVLIAHKPDWTFTWI